MPTAGGLFQQPPGYVFRMRDVLRAEAEAERINEQMKSNVEKTRNRASRN